MGTSVGSIALAPIAYQIAHESHADPKSFMVGLAICISTSSCTPVAHETTMLVMGPVSLQTLPFHRQRNGRHRLAAHAVRDTDDLEVLIPREWGNCHGSGFKVCTRTCDKDFPVSA
jgi:hypothetical protein